MNKTKKELKLEEKERKFLKESEEVHNFKYDYSEVIYKGVDIHVKIICKKHGVFWQLPRVHSKGSGCQNCNKERNKLSLTTEDYVNDCISRYSGYFKYPNTIYTGSGNRILVQCPMHGEISVHAGNHRLGKCGCPSCGKEFRADSRRKHKEDFVKEAKILYGKVDFNYDKFIYVNNKTKGIIGCPMHGDFEQTPTGHLTQNGCKGCSVQIRRDSRIQSTVEIVDKMIQKRGNDGYTFDKVNYIYTGCKVTITCNQYGDFNINAYDFLKGGNHPLRTNNHTSRPEKELYDFIKNLYPDAQSNVYGMIGRKELDIYIPNLNKAIEFNGTYWHYDQSNKNCKPKGYHAMKSNLCKDIGVKLLHVREDLWLNKKEHMKKVIRKFIES